MPKSNPKNISPHLQLQSTIKAIIDILKEQHQTCKTNLKTIEDLETQYLRTQQQNKINTQNTHMSCLEQTKSVLRILEMYVRSRNTNEDVVSHIMRRYLDVI